MLPEMAERSLTSFLIKNLRIHVDQEIDEIILQDRQNRSEEILRYLLLTLISIFAALYFMILFPILWIVIYIGTSVLTHRYIPHLRATTSRSPFFKVLICVGFRSITYRAMILIMWYYPHPAAHYVGIFMLVAAFGYSVNHKSSVRSYFLMQIFLDFIVVLVLAFEFLFFRPAFEGALIVGVAAFCLALYLIFTTRNHIQYLNHIEERDRQHFQSLKMEAVGRLTGGVAHDFNNILTVILGNLELHQEVEDPKERKLLISKTRDAAVKAADLTAQLLSFSRKSKLTLNTHKISDIFANVVEMTGRLLPENITLHHNIAPDTKPLRVDASQLEVAILNLIINARDAMKRGGEIELKAENYCRQKECPLPPDKYVAITVTDQGGGISDAIIDQVTEPFFTTKDVGEGSGLGLSMVKGFAEQTGGGMNIATVPGKSTTVTICIPSSE